MATDRPNWTHRQRQAIDARDSDVLVTASAGTGKTAVLSERCVRLLADTDDLTDVSQILVLTFTEAAAEEMRSRIAQTLRASFKRTRDSRIRRQLIMLDAAQISTIHAFCKRVITEHFCQLGIDPMFRIVDSDEQTLLRSESLEQTIEEAWADESLAPGLSRLLKGRDVKDASSGFLVSIVRLSAFLDGLVSRSDWYERASVITESGTAFAAGLADQQKLILLKKLARCESQFEHFRLLDERIAGGHWAGQMDDLLAPVGECVKNLKAGDIATAGKVLGDYKPVKFKNKPREMSKQQAEFIKAPAKKAIDSLKKLSDIALVNSEYDRLVAPSVDVQTKVMAELVRRFDRNYAEAKKRLNCLDFADLEHLALKLLSDDEAVAGQLGEKFRYIFVDEYQDINAVQQGILDKISTPDNVFVVGDVKQSIYGFRQSRPEIFLDKLRQAKAAGEQRGGPRRVDLSDNFRSRKQILDFANALFSRVMTASIASVDYDPETFLKAGLEYEPIEKVTCDGSRMPVEMYILDEDSADDEAGGEAGDPGGSFGQGHSRVISPAQRQAAFVASRIQRMVGADTGSSEFQIFDKETGRTRPVEYRDIVILMRSLSGRANEYVQVLQLAGVPVSSQSSAGYFAATEITDCVSVLKVLDNPRQDIELAAVLRSAIFRVTDSELAMIRSCGYEGPTEAQPGFYDRAVNYVKCGESEDLRCKLIDALKQIERWRKESRRGDLAELIWSVLRTTDYLSFVSALPNGPQRRANLLKLHDRAIQFEGFTGGGQAKSLTRFVDFIEKLLKEGQDWAPAQTENAAENAVRIMSIHKSKGLEFPVVFLAELNQRFNKKDSFGDCLIDETETIGLTIIDHESRVKLPGMAHEIIAEKKLDQTIAEEMRLLYVAVTRARERLVLTATQKANHCSSIVRGCGILGQVPPADWQLRQAQCHFDWLLYGLGNRRQLHDIFGISCDGDVADDDLFVARLLAADGLDVIANRILGSAHEKAAGAKEDGAKASALPSQTAKSLTDKIKASLNWRYPFESATKQRAKESVSLRTHRSDEFAKKSFTAALKQVPKAVSKDIAPDRREIGTAVHLVIRHLDLSGPVSADSVQTVIEKLVGAGLIAKETARLIDIGSIEKFFASELGVQAISAGNRLLREWPFTLAIDADGSAAGETTILQGIIDMIIPTASGFVIVDFKTDDVTTDSAHQRAATYAGQLEYYGKAAGAILEGEIAAKWLYFLKPGLAVAANS